MNRTVAIALTTLTALFCGLPGLGLICFAILGLIGSQLPSYEAGTGSSSDLALGVLIFICSGSVLLLIPVIVGFFSYRLNSWSEDTGDYPQPQPPGF